MSEQGMVITIDKDSMRAFIMAIISVIILISVMTIIVKKVDDYEIEQAIQKELCGFREETKQDIYKLQHHYHEGLKRRILYSFD